jgi:hypothetical protein
MFINKREEKETNCYTYKVEMVVQVFAENLDQATERLEANGGYVSSRIVNLLDSNVVYTGQDDDTKEPSETV